MKTKTILFLFIIILTAVLPVSAENESFEIMGYQNHPMQYKLISEAQAASDLAVFLGYKITPMDIMEQLPLTDDPNTGYVGYYDDAPSLPPNSYGTYQQPLAAALRALDISAEGYEGMMMDELKNAILSGTPVICWVAGHTTAGTPIPYQPKDGEATTVVQLMNSVTVTGVDSTGFIIWDNGKKYSRTFAEFETSWGILGNRGLIITPASALNGNDWWNHGDTPWTNSNGMHQPNESNPPIEPFGMIPVITPDFTAEMFPNALQFEDWTGANPQEPATGTETDFWGFYNNIPWGNESGSVNINLPPRASIEGFVGYPQSYNLDCETRSAVDLAAYFGFKINAYEFLISLPLSDDPNEGYVGKFTGQRGQLPPASYGVYQDPVAALLRANGFQAVGYKNFSWDQLRAEIASGHPVMVWVAGSTESGASVTYIPQSNGHPTLVVPFQHTVIVIGYDEQNVTLQDGGQKYTRPITTFLQSWGTLENRAIVYAQ